MNCYSNSEKVNILLIFIECRKNSREAAILYMQWYPGRNHLEKTFRNIKQHMRKIGKFPGKVSCSNLNRIRIIIIPQQYWLIFM